MLCVNRCIVFIILSNNCPHPGRQYLNLTNVQLVYMYVCTYISVLYILHKYIYETYNKNCFVSVCMYISPNLTSNWDSPWKAVVHHNTQRFLHILHTLKKKKKIKTFQALLFFSFQDHWKYRKRAVWSEFHGISPLLQRCVFLHPPQERSLNNTVKYQTKSSKRWTYRVHGIFLFYKGLNRGWSEENISCFAASTEDICYQANNKVAVGSQMKCQIIKRWNGTDESLIQLAMQNHSTRYYKDHIKYHSIT